MAQFNEFLGTVDDFVWGIPLIVAILAVGVLLTVRLKGMQFTKLGLGIKYMFQGTNKKKGAQHQGDVSSFQALCTA
ncbi:MAG: sodium:alanine symporter family protein, partial [Eubacterium sp.]|nr:sodium:alanine symporter family protein [Eubacterium sp.]